MFSRSRPPVLAYPPAPVRIPVSRHSPVSHGSLHGSTVFPAKFHGPSFAPTLHSPRSRSTARHSPVSRASQHLTPPKNPESLPLYCSFSAIIKSPTGLVFAFVYRLVVWVAPGFVHSTVRVFPVFNLFVSQQATIQGSLSENNNWC